jgi:hypothetical protein
MRMGTLTPVVLGIFLSAGGAGTAAASTADGTLTVNEKVLKLTSGRATVKKNPFDSKKNDVFLLFTDRAVAPGTLFDDFEIIRLPDAGVSGVTVQLTAEKEAISGTFFSPAFKRMKQFSSSGSQVVDITSWTDTRVAGSIRVPPGDFFDETYAYTVTFDLPIEAKPGKASLAGKPLPAGGGDPGKAYEAYRKAMASGNVPNLRKHLSAEMAAQTESEEFAEMLPMIQEMQPKKVRITGGSVDGDTATLLVTSLDEANASATVTMKREAGAWKVAKEAWKHTSD